VARFTFTPLAPAGLIRVERQRLDDERGFFSRFFCAEEFREVGFDRPIAQINHTLTRRKSAVRGLHFQHPPHTEIKLVSCLRGSVFDVAVDLRRDSPTFLSWHGEVLCAADGHGLLIPRGFAHGFQALDADSELVYLHSDPFVADAEGAVSVFDPRIGIEWPLPVSDLSARDRAHPPIGPEFAGLSP